MASPKVTIKGNFNDASELPPSGELGNAYIIDSDLYTWSDSHNTWINAGPVEGPKGPQGPEGDDSVSSSNGGIWQPKHILSTEWGVNDVPSGQDPDEVLNSMIEPLRSANSEYITRTSIGLSEIEPRGDFAHTIDGPEQWPIWRYDFEPENGYEKTLILFGCLHGNEYTGYFTLARFLQELCERPEQHPALSYIRHNVKIIAVPIANPWGFKNSKRQNINDVDLNRNFDYNFGSGGGYYAGPSAFSEAESQHLRDMLQAIEDAGEPVVATHDFHTTTTEGETEYIVYYPRFLENSVDRYVKLSKMLRREGEHEVFSSTTIATLTNWTVYKHGWNGANPEFVNNINNKGIRNSYEMNRAMRWFGNLILQASLYEFKGGIESLHEPQVYAIKYDERDETTDTMSFSKSSFTSMLNTTFRFNVKNEGIATFNGYAVVHLDVETEIGIIPQIYQVGSPDFTFSATSADQFNEIYLTLPAGDHVIPLQSDCVLQATSKQHKEGTNKRAKEVVFQLRVRCVEAGHFKHVRGQLTVLPTSDGSRYTRIKADTRSNGSPYTPTIVYPTGDGVSYDF